MLFVVVVVLFFGVWLTQFTSIDFEQAAEKRQFLPYIFDSCLLFCSLSNVCSFFFVKEIFSVF